MPLPDTPQSWIYEHRHSIEIALAKGLVLPAVTLIYTVIDSLGFLARPTAEINPGDDYEAWVRDYLLAGYNGSAGPAAKIAHDLYGARCAVLHRMTAEANLTADPDPNRRAREVYYERRSGEGRVPVESASTPEPALFVDPDLLAESLFQAVECFEAALDADGNLRQRVEERATHYFHVTRAASPEVM